MVKNEQPADGIDWSLTTWEGSRREQLRHWAAFTLRERMQSLEDMAEVAERFREMHKSGKFSDKLSPTEAPAVHQTPPRFESTG